MKKRRTYTLRFILEMLVVFSVLATILIEVISSLHVNRTSLSSNYLENNYHYAKKLAKNTTDILTALQNNIDAIAKQAGDKPLKNTDLQAWYMANRQYFHSLLIADATGHIQAVSPAASGVTAGTLLTSHAARLALSTKKPLISEPYHGVSGRLILLISSPIFDSRGVYKGFAGGTIYLEDSNVLNRILKEHFYRDGSYVYVVDQQGRLIFHPDTKRLGETVRMNPAIHQALAGNSGYRQIVNSKGQSFFAGFTVESVSGWVIVSQTPTSVIDESNRKLLNNLLVTSLPFLLLTLGIVWLIAKNISTALSRLAHLSDESGHIDSPAVITTTSKIYEIQKLYQSTRLAIRQMNRRLRQLQSEVETDGLTGLANRKTFDAYLQHTMQSEIPFSLILLDVDRFKKINDDFGHLTGDEVLKLVARTMQASTREDDFCFRYGGEEFGILLQGRRHLFAYQIAERLRQTVEAMDNPTGQPVTISLGIASYPLHGTWAVDIITCADQALYHSKATGRNKTTCFRLEVASL
ncbi:sensor domain-containing diguanylate cyclase [Brevibacillus agri]|uniref:sensor domain-containing diguanylate cyclase n=1 Tax=Brevibacillus agri TaxID=51101 RepID=UPI003D1CA6F1